MSEQSTQDQLEEVIDQMIQAGEDLPAEVEERLMKWEGEEAREALVEVLRDEEMATNEGPESYASIHAARFLGERGEPEAVEPLLETIEEVDALAIIYSAAIEAIGNIGEPALEPTVAAYEAAAERGDTDNMLAFIDAAHETGAASERLSEALAKQVEYDPGFVQELIHQYGRADEVVEKLEDHAQTIADIPEDMRTDRSRIHAICSTIEAFDGEVPDALRKYTDGPRTAVEQTSDDADEPFFPPEQGSPSHRKNQPYVDKSPDVGRNDPCPCGSGRKYKKCCMRKE